MASNVITLSTNFLEYWITLTTTALFLNDVTKSYKNDPKVIEQFIVQNH
jgi:hypothetical protein